MATAPVVDEALRSMSLRCWRHRCGRRTRTRTV